MRRVLDRTAWVAREHPFLLSLIVLLLIMIPGLIRVEQIQRSACRAANGARHDQIALWTYVIGISAGPHQTAAEKATVAAFDRRLHQIFAPRHCGML